MQKVELLAPAGSMEALIAAVQNGCDAVYLGGTMFGARAYADNFDEAGMIEALRYAHGYGVKVYVTMNTLIYESEMETAIAYVKFLYEQGVDALIIQDLGLFDVVHQCFPQLELHASTQMHIHNEAGIQLMREAGMKRIVLPRETTIEEVQRFAHMGVETEVFVQGALCISYSGQCLMSAKKLSRSGNRGACAQMCRMKYRLGRIDGNQISYMTQSGDYLLSPKDLNTLAKIPELIEAGITSFKIEGRMKRAAYVAQMTAVYRCAIDAYYQHHNFAVDVAMKDMEKVFHRGFTEGHLFHQQGHALMNPLRPNHMGVEIGRTLSKKGRRVSIQLTDGLHQYDGIRILCDQGDVGCVVNKLYDHHRLVNSAAAGAIVEVEVDGAIPKGSVVVKTSDVLQLEQLRQSYENGKRKVSVFMRLTLRIDQVPTLSVWDDAGHECEVWATDKAKSALHHGLTKERLRQQLKKCGNTIFEAAHIELQTDSEAIVAIKVINDLRRRALDTLYRLRTQAPQSLPYGRYQRHIECEPLSGCYVRVQNEQQAGIAKQMGVKHLYGEPRLYQKLHPSDYDLGYVGMRVMTEAYPASSFLFSEVGALSQKGGIAEHFMNITNSYAAAFLFAHGVKGIILSNECDDHQIAEIQTAFNKRYGCLGSFLSYGYGKEELMVMKHCPIRTALDKKEHPCGLCHGSKYFLSDIQDHHYPLYGDENCHIHILDDTAQIRHPQSAAVFLCFYDESETEVKEIIKKFSSFITHENSSS